MSKRQIDLVIHINGLILEDGETEDDVVKHIEDKYPSLYPCVWRVDYEETLDD